MTLDFAPTPDTLGRPRKPRGKRTLASLLREVGVLSSSHAVEVALAICDALSTAHANGVVHGQLGLGYVRLRFTSEAGPSSVEIFTLAPEADDSGVNGGVATGLVFTEPPRGDGSRGAVDIRSDVWALGALLYAMLHGMVPPAGHIVVSEESIPRSLGSLIEACLAVDPAARPANVDDIAERIACFASWPPDHFARLAARRESRLAAERVRENLERRGLSDIPNVLDKLDGAAVARAQRDEAVVKATVRIGPSTKAAMARLAAAVHEGTDAARAKHAAALPMLVDFDDDDDDVDVDDIAAVANSASRAAQPVVSPLAVAFVPSHFVALTSPAPEPRYAAAAPFSFSPSSMSRAARVAAAFAIVIAICATGGCVGYAASKYASAAVP